MVRVGALVPSRGGALTVARGWLEPVDRFDVANGRDDFPEDQPTPDDPAHAARIEEYLDR
ncbi:hypothetical protein [Kineococcus sp. SYSU DK003]|uniref:hypothetical protein n=1 Tax=Kineococcus sp. SYSU DK003 TaxID=3383124 RepID=UPI003D7DD29B